MNKTFKLKLNSGHLRRYSILNTGKPYLVLKRPRRKWYQLLWQGITFGRYKASWIYTIKAL